VCLCVQCNESWGVQGHPRHWKFGKGVPRWIQFNNNGREIEEPAKVPAVHTVDAKEVYDLVLAKAGC
jgi:pectate lyase